MGKIEGGINGPFRGKTGSVIGSSWRKINYIKGLPRKIKRKPSPRQALQRAKFVLLNQFFDPVANLLEIGFNQYTSKATGRNVAFSVNFDHAFVNEGENVALNYPALQFSQGSLFPAGDEKAWLEGDTLHVTWDPHTYGMGRSMDDKAFLVLYDETDAYFIGGYEALRLDGGIQATEEELASRSHKFHLWLFFADKARKQVSRTVYIPIENGESE